MKNFKKPILLLVALVTLFSCAKEYDDSELRGRIESLEAWQKTVNGQIVALQGLVSALENKDYVTSVTELADKSGYVIAFSKSGPVTIKHGQKGADATAPVVGVKKDTDGKYYWTLDGEFITTGGSQIPTTGDKGETGNDGLTPHIGENGNWWIGTTDTGVKAQGAAGNDAIAPKVRINPQTNEWEISVDGGTNYAPTGVQATGDKGDTGATGAQGDAIFLKDGIDLSDPDNVTFTLADGVTKITLPRAGTLTIGFDSYEPFQMTPYTINTLPIILPTDFRQANFSAIKAEVTSSNGTSTDIETRATSATLWGVQVTKPTFADGILNKGGTYVTLTAPQGVKSEIALLKVTIVDSKGNEASATRTISWHESLDTWDGTVASAFAGGDGSDSAPYLIANGAQLAYLAQFVNSSKTPYDSKYYKLTSDIDLNNIPWTPIGGASDNGREFYNAFDGDEHTIYNLAVTISNNRPAGLFGHAGSSTKKPYVIKNLTVKNAEISGAKEAGVLIGLLTGPTPVIENCHVSGRVTTTGIGAGGFIGDANWATIKACTSDVEVTGESSAGGFIGQATYKTTIENCTASGSVKGTWVVGGFVGYLYSDGNDAQCLVKGCSSYVSVTASDWRCGGFVGFTQTTDDKKGKTTITDCSVYGSITSTTNVTGWDVPYAKTGGFAGATNMTTLENCSSSVTMTAVSRSTCGAFIGYDEYGSSSVNCWYDGTKISDLAPVGLIQTPNSSTHDDITKR